MSSRALTELLHGQGAHADPVACIDDLPAELAAQRAEGFPHSIGQLVFHMNYWMDYELRRIRGKRPAYPEHSAESFRPRRRPPMHRTGIVCESALPACSPNSPGWRILPRKKCSARSKPCTKAIHKSLARFRPYSGKWSRTTVITPARSRRSGACWARGPARRWGHMVGNRRWSLGFGRWRNHALPAKLRWTAEAPLADD